MQLSNAGAPVERPAHPRDQMTLDEVKINLLWLPQAQFAGYLVAEHLQLGRKRGVRIENTPLEFTVGPVRAVGTDTAQFGVASPSHLLESEQPENFRLLLVFQQDSPLVYPVRRDSGIETLPDLAGKRVAVWPGREDLELCWMLHRSGLKPEQVERVPKTDTVAAFADGEVESAQMTCYHELHLLEDRGFSLDRLRLFRAGDYGAALVKDGLITSRSLVEANPDLVQRVVDTVLEGWTRAFADPQRAVKICLAARPDHTQAQESRQFDDIRMLTFRGATMSHGLGYPDRTHLERAIQACLNLGQPVDAGAGAALLDARFWNNAPREFRPRR